MSVVTRPHDLFHDSRPRNGTEQTNRDIANVGRYFELAFGLGFLSSLGQTFGGTSKRFATFGAIRVVMRRERPAKHALHDEPRGACGAFLSGAFMQKPARRAGDAVASRICDVGRSTITTNQNARFSWSTARHAGGEGHGAISYHELLLQCHRPASRVKSQKNPRRLT